MSTVVWLLLSAVIVCGTVGSVVVCWLKGKRAMAGAGVVAVVLAYWLWVVAGGSDSSSLGGVLALAGLVLAITGAVRLARPMSGWATMRYDEARMAASWQRFGTDPAGVPQPPVATAHPPRSIWPAESRWALWAVGLAVPLSVVSMIGLATVGATIPTLFLAAAGGRQYRRAATVTAAVGAVLTLVVNAFTDVFTVLLALPGLAVLGVAVALLYRPRVQAWLG